jgi:CarD family transcriptional regulator, regulator of rRNA transcription
LYEIGDKVVYPHHGAGAIVKKESHEVLGAKREHLTIKILHNDLTVQVPSENADAVGLRRVIGEKEVPVVLKALTGGSTEMPKNWSRRFRHNRDKLKTGDVFELAEVVRNLSLRDHEKALSTVEKQMFVKAKKILASELMYAKTMDEDECTEWLEECSPPAATARRRRRLRRRRPSRRACNPRLASVGAIRRGRGSHPSPLSCAAPHGRNGARDGRQAPACRRAEEGGANTRGARARRIGRAGKGSAQAALALGVAGRARGTPREAARCRRGDVEQYAARASETGRGGAGARVGFPARSA